MQLLLKPQDREGGMDKTSSIVQALEPGPIGVASEELPVLLCGDFVFLGAGTRTILPIIISHYLLKDLAHV